jgi:hypothetical protein
MGASCGVSSYKDFRGRKVKTKIDGTNTYKACYYLHYKGIPISEDEENAINASGKKSTFYLPKPLTVGEASSQFHMAYR